MERIQAFRVFGGLALVVALAVPAVAVTVPQDAKHQTLAYKADGVKFDVAQLSAVEAGEALVNGRLAALGADAATSYVDLRTGRFTGLELVQPLLPGKGYGNHLTWADLGRRAPRNDQEIREAAAGAYTDFLARNAEALQVDLAEMAHPGRITVINPDYIIISTPHVVDGLPVLGSSLIATIRYGNLVLWGAINWGDVDRAIAATVSEAQARETVSRHIAPFDLGSLWKGSSLAWLPYSTETSFSAANAGRALDHRLVWVVRPTLGQDGDHWQALVDARTGELLSFEDLHQFVATQRKVQGGVFPISNDGLSPGGIPDGVEQAGYPMSFSYVLLPGVGYATTDVGGNLPLCVDGTISSSLEGPYLKMNDTCGSPTTSSASHLDFGTSAGTDCTVPPGTGLGNTHASRSGFYEMNQIKAIARAELPANPWPTEQMPANMNVIDTCNAFWDGTGVNFFRSGGGCRNTGELAGIFDHEWGHGMDDNDANGSILATGSEGIADIYASLRTDDSCIGRGFKTTACGGYGNPCIDPPGDAPLCTGVRDVDWANRAANDPFTDSDAAATCPNGGTEVHCVGYVNAETIWDLWNRDLTAAPFALSRSLARIIATQQTYRAAGAINNWWSAGTGCAADTGYQQYLAADDDNGNLGDGTPHAGAIFAAHDRHGIACGIAPANSGCAGAPTAAPTVTPTARDKGVDLSWTSVAGAVTYRVYRTDGVHGCDFGKVLVAETAGTSFSDTGLQNGRNYYYEVVPMGAADECFGAQASSCTTGTPSAAGGGSLFAAVGTAGGIDRLSGDGDVFLDNCEQARVRVPLGNTGSTTLTNVQILSATSPSHPGTEFVTTFPKVVDASLVPCETSMATLEFIAHDLDPGETLTIELEVGAAEVASPQTVQVSYPLVEGDFQSTASRTFSFESSTEGWNTAAGTFNRTNASPGGAGGAGTFYYQSSSFLDDQCDVVRSPLLRLTAGSTMVLSTRFNIEAFSSLQWWDRANAGLLDPLAGLGGERTVVSPSSGRLYNASGVGGTCGTEGQAGWADVSDSWATSSWTSTALQTSTFAGKPVYLDVRYGTDAAVNGFGFRFDDVTLTNLDVEVADSQSNTCAVSNYLFSDGFETANTQEWSQTSP